MEKLDKKNKNYTLNNNFLSTNCYSCIELNSHSLLLLIIHFRDNDLFRQEMFKPWNFSSQTCKKFFRATRSLTSTYSTVVNFSMKDILSRLHQIENLSTIKSELSSYCSGLIFPIEKLSVPSDINKFNDLTNEKISNIINKSLSDAKHVSENLLEMITDENEYRINKPIFKNSQVNMEQVYDKLTSTEKPKSRDQT